MWIQIKYGDRLETINTKKIIKICIIGPALFVNFSYKEFSKFVFQDSREALAWYDGFQLAIQGHDFISVHSEYEKDYIKPLLASKNEAIYRYMMLKEMIGENI